VSLGLGLPESAIDDIFSHVSDSLESGKDKAVDDGCVEQLGSLAIGCTEVVVECEPGLDVSEFAGGLLVEVEVYDLQGVLSC
jgi:hypothetical protein